MSAQGKIKTLFSDKEKTEPLYPRTKMSAISNNDGIGLEAILDGAVYSDNNVIQSTVVPVNADTLGGRKASEYATNEFVIDKITEAQLSGGSGEILEPTWQDRIEAQVTYNSMMLGTLIEEV